ncbi:MAG: hypothetical protein EOP64_13525 [Sphingomonas sp.]|nr:MAG: hypothetical protein EOP64_13525 [Sphingomonas sp.]
MDAHFSIEIEPERCLIHIIMGGFFGNEDMSEFRNDLTEKLYRLGCSPNDHLTLCDVSAMKIQTQDMVGVFSNVVGDPVFRSRKLAFVTGSTLARMQTRRLTNREGVAYFTDADEARKWLSQK